MSSQRLGLPDDDFEGYPDSVNAVEPSEGTFPDGADEGVMARDDDSRLYSDSGRHGDSGLYDDSGWQGTSGGGSAARDFAERPGGRLSAAVTRMGSFGRAHFGVVCVVCVVVMVATGGYLLRARSSQIAGPAPAAQVVSSSASGDAVGASPSSSASYRVHVTGAVVNPGVQVLSDKARVIDALAAAGGLRDDADPGELNMAAPVCDGCQLIIGTKGFARGELRDPGGAVTSGEIAGGGASAAGGKGSGGTGTGGAVSGTAGSAKININTANSTALDQLPGVGPVTAEKIIAWRTQHGRFARIEQLQEVDGIGAKSYERIKDNVTVG